MKRRILSFLLVLVIVISMVPANVFAASRTTSDACISLIKAFEGFAAKPYYDNGQYTVGYGTRCPAEDLERYLEQGITEAEATALLRDCLHSFEAAVNNFDDKYSLDLNQNEFDALVSFTYNVGTGWMNTTEKLFPRTVIEGGTGNEFIFALTMWCVAGGNVLSGLINRRLVEANMFLNGVYSTVAPTHYSYVKFDHVDSIYNGRSQTVRVQGYDAAATDVVRPIGVLEGHRFLGWYTAASGGEWVSHLDASTAGKTLYAHWQEGDGDPTAGTAANYQRTTTESTKVYAKPTTSSTVKNTLAKGTEITIVADYVDSDGVKWGKLASGYWVQLGKTNPDLTQAEESAGSGVTVTVTGTNVNIRSGPGTGYSRVRYATQGEQLVIISIQDVDGVLWGECSSGWICLTYTDYSEQTGEAIIATGTVNVSGSLTIRSGAGTGYGKVGSLSDGTRVEIYEIVTVGSVQWGRIDKGWISLKYVDLDTGVEDEEETEEETEPVIATGSVTASDALNIRSGAGTDYGWVGTLLPGTRVEIYEIVTVNGTPWGRISAGWICLDYVALDDQAPAAPVLTASNVASTGKIRLTWKAVSGAVKYKVYRAASKTGTYTLLKTVTGTSFTNTAAEAGKSYYYKVVAVGSDGTASPASNIVLRTCDLAQPEISLSNVAATGKIRVAWKAVDGAAGYEVYRAAGKNDTYQLMYTTTATSYTNTSAVAGSKYYYKVVALGEKSAADSAPSAAKYRTCDVAQPEISLSNVASSGKIRVTWKAVDGAAGYEIYRATSKTGTYKLMYTTTGTSYTNTSAKAGSKYYYKVVALGENSAADSVPSAAKYRTCDLARPDVSIGRSSSGKPKLTWDAVDGAVTYQVYRSTSKTGTYKLMYTTTGTGYTNTGATAGKTYYYKVVALASRSAADSAYSSVVSIKSK